MARAPAHVHHRSQRIARGSGLRIGFPLRPACFFPSFYLSAQQCDRANDARERVELAREQSGSAITRFGYDEIQPNSEMDDTYFLPEPELADSSVEVGEQGVRHNYVCPVKAM